MNDISPQELDRRHREHEVELVDVRTPVEFGEVHVEYARNIPLQKLDPEAFQRERKGSEFEPVYLICNTGSRGQIAREKFRQLGYDNVFNVDGGTTACIENGLPLKRGKKAISLERQVRIAAGSLIVSGVVLGFLVHSSLHAIAGLIGAGLVFAGLTNTCGMGMLIAKMPWNQVTTCEASDAQSSQRKNQVTTENRVSIRSAPTANKVAG